MQAWTEGVELELHGVGAYRTVRSTEDAASCLLAHWPRGKGTAYVAAQQACLDALEGTGSPEAARTAFIHAAKAARIHIRSSGERPRPVRPTDAKAFREANSRATAKARANLVKSPVKP